MYLECFLDGSFGAKLWTFTLDNADNSLRQSLEYVDDTSHVETTLPGHGMVLLHFKEAA